MAFTWGLARPMSGSRKKVRVLVNGIHGKSGGGLTYLRNLLPALANHEDLELHLFVHAEQFALLNPVDERIRLHLMNFSISVGYLLLWEQVALPLLARVMGAQVTLSPANYGPLAAPRPIIMLRNSLAVVGRDTRLPKRLYWVALAVMTALSLLFCRRAIAVSNYAKHTLTFGMHGWLGSRIAVIPHGVSEIFKAGGETAERKRFLLVVADIYIQKNLHTLIKAMVPLHERFPDIKLRIAGQPLDLGYYGELLRLVRDNKLEGQVEMLGSVGTEQLRSLYRSCLALVFPSTVETFGNPLVEAMACGAPIACSRLAAMPEIAADAASYFDPLSVGDIARVIGELILDPNRRAILASNGLARAAQYSWVSTAEKTAALLREAAQD